MIKDELLFTLVYKKIISLQLVLYGCKLIIRGGSAVTAQELLEQAIVEIGNLDNGYVFIVRRN